MDDWAGTDFYLGDDLGSSAQGDYTLASDTKNVDLAVIRRILTPLGSLFYDDTYGNRLYDRLGETMDNVFAEEARQDLYECLKYEDRIEVMAIDVLTENEKRKANFRITYRYQREQGGINVLEGGITDGGLSIQNRG